MAKRTSKAKGIWKAQKAVAKAELYKVRSQLKAWRTMLRKLESKEKKLCKQSKRIKPGGGRPKGNSFERLVASMVVRSFSKLGITSKHCYRTPGSGGHRFASKTDPGDLVIRKKLLKHFPFSVECKWYKEIVIYAFLYPPKDWLNKWHFRSWLNQAIRDAKKQKRNPLLVFKGNNTPVFAALPVGCTGFGIAQLAKRSIQFKYKKEDWMVIRFTDLLRQLSKVAMTEEGLK
jgi:hypothetical protein